MESPKAAGPNAQAGPSNPFQSSHAPSAADEEELNRISASLSQRSHRRSSVFSSATRKAGKAGKTVTSRIPIPPNLKRHESDDEAEYEGLDEDEICRLEQKKYEKRREEALKEIRERSGVIDIVGNVEGGSDRGVKGDKQEYVWDVLFENQRGLYLLGKSYFSSRTLLPADPSAYTLPSHSLPSASSFTVSQPASDGVNTTRSEHRVQAKHQKKEQGKRGITTAYTLDTFQTPSPAWIWLTPWMTNMRPGTDESGWRYNYWFKSNGWKSHAGLAGWGGWVRRREWVRLRCLNPEEEVLDGPKEPELDVGPHQSLGQVMKKNEVDGIVKALSKVALDRQKLETWDVWLKEASQDEKDKLERILSDEDHLHKISRSFTYQSSFASLKATLADYDIRLSSSIGGTPTTISPHDPSTPDTEKGYDVPRPTSKPDQQGTPSISPKHDIDD